MVSVAVHTLLRVCECGCVCVFVFVLFSVSACARACARVCARVLVCARLLFVYALKQTRRTRREHANKS